MMDKYFSIELVGHWYD